MRCDFPRNDKHVVAEIYRERKKAEKAIVGRAGKRAPKREALPLR
jgi:hypothetical protein